MKANYIKQGDCLELMKEIDNECIDLTVTSPPYDNLRVYKGFAWDFEGIARELYRVTKKGGVVVWVVNDATVNGSETGTSFRQALFFMECGFNLHDTMIWRKPNPFNFGSNNCYIQSFEYMFVFSKGAPCTRNFIFDRAALSYGKEIISQTRRGDFMEVDKTKKRRVTKEMTKRHNVWDIPTASGQGLHPAVFPEQLAKDHITSWSNEGDVVLDPFLGSGTTAKVAVMTDRKYIGFDIAQEYIEIAKQRIEDAEHQRSFEKSQMNIFEL